jgi:hypothetical protein
MRRLVSTALIAVVGLGLWSAAQFNDDLRDARRAHAISQADPLVNAPPLVAFTTVALGGFRGLVADILWLRSARLQEEGRYFELVQLADWITKLEPRFTSVWAYHAWNLAYNISVLLERPEERWRWVRHGIHLLRDEGLRYNPGDARLLYELGWLFQHKVGGDMDSAHLFYKRAWADEMSRLWDGPTPDFGTLSRAAATRAELLARPGAAEAIAALEAAGRNPFSFARIDEARAAPANDPLRSPGGRELTDHLRRRLIEDHYKLDPLTMREIDERYGPLDWRLPQAHSLYWAWQSRRVARREFDQVSADRMIFQSLADAFRQGNLYYNPARNLFILSPNPALTPRVQAAYEDALARHADNESIRTAHANFLREAIVIRYIFNQLAEARSLFAELRNRYPNETGGLTFEAFVQEQYLARQSRMSPADARAIVEGALYQSEFWQFAGDSDRAAGFAGLARLTWERHQTRISASPEMEQRLSLPPFDEIRRLVRARVREDLGL